MVYFFALPRPLRSRTTRRCGWHRLPSMHASLRWLCVTTCEKPGASTASPLPQRAVFRELAAAAADCFACLPPWLPDTAGPGACLAVVPTPGPHRLDAGGVGIAFLAPDLFGGEGSRVPVPPGLFGEVSRLSPQPVHFSVLSRPTCASRALLSASSPMTLPLDDLLVEPLRRSLEAAGFFEELFRILLRRKILREDRQHFLRCSVGHLDFCPLGFLSLHASSSSGCWRQEKEGAFCSFTLSFREFFRFFFSAHVGSPPPAPKNQQGSLGSDCLGALSEVLSSGQDRLQLDWWRVLEPRRASTSWCCCWRSWQRAIFQRCLLQRRLTATGCLRV